MMDGLFPTEEARMGYIKSMCKMMGLNIEDDVINYVDDFVKDFEEMQYAFLKLQKYSTLMAMDVDVEVAKKILNTEFLKEAIDRNKMKLMHIRNVVFKYLVNDKTHIDYGKYNVFELISGTLKIHNDEILLFQAKCKEDNKSINIKLLSKNNSFFITSDFFEQNNSEHELDFFRNSNDVIFHKCIHGGEIYMHISYDQDK